MKGLKQFIAAVVVGVMLGTVPAEAALSTQITITIQATQTASLQLGAPSFPVVKKYVFSWPSGVGASQADRLFTDTRTLAASANEDLDLAGVLVDAFGAAITFARINAMVVCAKSTNVNNITLGGAASNQFLTWVGAGTHTLTIRPGGCEVLIAPDGTGYAVTAGTGDLLRVTNAGAGTSVTYDIFLIGRSS